MTNAIVILSWVPHAKGGRKAPPVPPADNPDYWYSTIVRFDSDPQWLKGTWSLVLFPKKIWGDGRFWVAEASFLMENAPIDLLSAGARFEMLEGHQVVLHGMVADPARTEQLSPAMLEDVLLV